jgi:hypothetical protein
LLLIRDRIFLFVDVFIFYGAIDSTKETGHPNKEAGISEFFVLEGAIGFRFIIRIFRGISKIEKGIVTVFPLIGWSRGKLLRCRWYIASTFC